MKLLLNLNSNVLSLECLETACLKNESVCQQSEGMYVRSELVISL